MILLHMSEFLTKNTWNKKTAVEQNFNALLQKLNNLNKLQNLLMTALEKTLPVFLIHTGTQQLPRKMPTCIERKHYQVGKKLPTSVLYRTQILYFNPVMFRLEHLSLVQNIVIHFQDHRQEINAL